MKILITGGTGFIGSNLAAECVRRGHEVFVTGRERPQPDAGTYVGPDFTDLDFAALGGIDAMFHEAAIADTTNLDREEMFRVNSHAPVELFERVVKDGCRRIVYASSTAVYGDAPVPFREDGPMHPLNPYAESKKLLDERAMDFAARHPDVTVVGLRYCNVYGPGEAAKGRRATMIWQLAQQMLDGNPKLFKNGEQKRDYIYIKDVVRVNMAALEARESDVFNCASGQATSFNELVEILNDVLGFDRTPEYVENPYGDRYQSYTLCDIGRIKAKLGVTPQFNIRSGIEDYYWSGFLVPLTR